MGLHTKTYWLTDRQSQCDFDFCELFRKSEASYFGSKADRELPAKFGGQQLGFSWAWDLAAEGSIDWSQRSEYEVGVRWSPACKDVSPEAEEHSPLEAVTKQNDWGH
jgi:hypothetical protein